MITVKEALFEFNGAVLPYNDRNMCQSWQLKKVFMIILFVTTESN